jgi:sec-independent protein translocase protein TatA
MSLPGGPEMLIILFVLLLLFGASKLPSLARSMGQAGKEFRAGMRDGARDEDRGQD